MDLPNMLNNHLRRNKGWNPTEYSPYMHQHQRHPEQQARDVTGVQGRDQQGLHMNPSYPTSNGMQPMHVSNQMPGYPEMPGVTSMPSVPVQQMPQPQPPRSAPTQPTKSYPCSTCTKQFARRSDLARHERIHSGHRPHMCDYPNCGKQFIQRSALTVHQRVHTGEKPHHCEICAKPFSDSSSLARHRRTHSGKRPYKCPYADCQKTFTRRTTLTRHQNHHSGTIEEAAAATAATLATKGKIPTQARSEGDHLSAHGSPMTTPSPAQRTMSMSPGVDVTGATNMPRHPTDLQYMQQNGPLPVHLRVGSPTSTSSAGYSSGIRPTSHPTGYGPPPTLEPSLDQHPSGPGSAGSSPHMSSVGWQSPAHVPSPQQNDPSYVYPDPGSQYPQNLAMNQMYYNPAHQQRRHPSNESAIMHMV